MNGQTDTLRAKRFVLEDENGNVSAAMRTTDDGPVVELYDQSGEPRLSLTVDSNGIPSVGLLDENGFARVALLADQAESTVMLGDANGELRAELHITDYGPTVDYYDDNGVARLIMAVDSSAGPGLVMFDDDENLIWKAPN